MPVNAPWFGPFELSVPAPGVASAVRAKLIREKLKDQRSLSYISD
jgi:D-hexose-6-phosphate mutarotase